MALAGTSPLNADMFDVKGKPPGIISDSLRKQLWGEYTHVKQCFPKGNNYPDHVKYKVTRLTSADWKALSVVSPYPASIIGLGACAPTQRPETSRDLWDQNKPPNPIETVGEQKNYGDQLEAEQLAAFWFEMGLTTYRRTNKPDVAKVVTEALVSWAKSKALSRNQYDGPEFKFPVTLLIEAMQNAFFELAATMTPEDRATIGSYLNGEIAEVELAGASRPSNHDNLYAYMGAIWGLAANDRLAVKQAIDSYKRNIQDMRPDGSWPIDSQRGANANQYVSMATGDLVMLAALLKSRLGLDLFSYEVDGRSIHTAVNYVLKMIEDPKGTSLKYALACTHGDFMDNGVLRTRENPITDYAKLNGRAGRSFNEVAFLAVYSSLFPKSAAAKWVEQNIPETYKFAVPTHFLQAVPACLLNARNPTE